MDTIDIYLRGLRPWLAQIDGTYIDGFLQEDTAEIKKKLYQLKHKKALELYNYLTSSTLPMPDGTVVNFWQVLERLEHQGIRLHPTREDSIVLLRQTLQHMSSIGFMNVLGFGSISWDIKKREEIILNKYYDPDPKRVLSKLRDFGLIPTYILSNMFGKQNEAYALQLGKEFVRQRIGRVLANLNPREMTFQEFLEYLEGDRDAEIFKLVFSTEMA